MCKCTWAIKMTLILIILYMDQHVNIVIVSMLAYFLHQCHLDNLYLTLYQIEEYLKQLQMEGKKRTIAFSWFPDLNGSSSGPPTSSQKASTIVHIDRFLSLRTVTLEPTNQSNCFFCIRLERESKFMLY